MNSLVDLASLELLPVTKTILIGVGAVSLGCLAGLLSPGNVYLNWGLVLHKFQFWRPITAFFYGGSGYTLLFDTVLLFQTSTALEKDVYGDWPSYMWINLVFAGILLITNFVTTLNLPFLFKPHLSALVYLWTKANPNLTITLFGLVSLPARLYPLVITVIDLLTSGLNAALGDLAGIAAGHLWWYLATYLPTQAPLHLRRANPLAMPGWLRRQFPIRGHTTSATASSARHTLSGRGVEVIRPRTDDAAARVRHRWGSGQKLGGTPL